MNENQKPKKLYLIWNDDDDVNYFEQYDTLDDAVSSRCEGHKVEVFIANVKRLGLFKRGMKVTRVKQRKKRK